MKGQKLWNKPGFILVTGVVIGVCINIIFMKMGVNVYTSFCLTEATVFVIYIPLLVERLYLTRNNSTVNILSRMFISAVVGLTIFILWVKLNIDNFKEMSNYERYRDFIPEGTKITAIIVLLGCAVSFLIIESLAYLIKLSKNNFKEN
jgi:hypothetical protein